jgi:LuxR family transcriptional regulator, maltose regulon positive regulatory protein
MAVRQLHSGRRRQRGRSRPGDGGLRPPTPGRAGSPPAPRLDVIETKLRPPALRPGLVPRVDLVNRLRRSNAPVVSVVAPVGYGKTTVLAEWERSDTRTTLWVSVDDRDNDPFVLLKHVLAAVDRVKRLDRRLLASVVAGRKPTLASMIERVSRAAASCREPLLLVLDNVDLVHSRESRRLIVGLIAGLPPGSTVALAARTALRLPIASLRERGDLREIGVADLALSKREAQLLLQSANPAFRKRDVAYLVELCEGWPAALYLASVSIRERGATSASRLFEGSDRYLADYVRSEYLSRLRPQELRLLRRSSILGLLSGPACDAVLQEKNCDLVLEKLARTHLVLVPHDPSRGTYRIHRLFRDLLLRDLLEEEPEVVPGLHRRAMNWYERRGDPESALEHAEAAGDADHMAALLTAIAIPASCRGGITDLEERLTSFDRRHKLDRYPAVAVHGSRIHAFRGRTADAERWLDVAERGARRRGTEAMALRPRVALVRAALCRDGPRRMLGDAGAALVSLPRTSQWYQIALLLRGCAALLLGVDDEADSHLGQAAAAAEVQGCHELRMLAISERSLIARARHDDDRADLLSVEALHIALSAELESSPMFALTLAASARASLRNGRWAEARDLVAASEPLRASLTEALPWLTVSTRLELARSYLTLRDAEAAEPLMTEIGAILAVRPRLGTLVGQARELERELHPTPLPREHARSGLTHAELRLLPLLGTHLSFREIADQLEVSRNTVKTQAISIYRKLGVSGRSEAVAAAAAESRFPGIA